MKLFDFNDPFFRPLWIRILLVAVAGGWGVLEFATGSPFWGIIFCAIAAVAFHGLFIAFEPRAPKEKETEEE